MESSRKVDLPEELIREILLRLPVKALLQCKCVCKEWCALIESRSFIDGHYCHECNPDCLLIQFNSYRNVSKFAMCRDDGSPLRNKASNYLSWILSNGTSFDLLDPANGVFCVVRGNRHIALFNPATRKFKPVPTIPLPELSYLEFGFGYDHLSGGYKVVVFKEKKKSKRLFCVYSSITDSWRKGEVAEWFCGSTFGGKHDVFLNGVLYRMNRDVHDYVSIHAFDTRSENFREIIGPDAIREAMFMVWMTAYDDSVALLSHVERCVDLWVMGRNGLWTKSFSIALPQLYIYPLLVRNKNEMFLGTIVALFLCDISTQEISKFGPDIDPKNSYRIFSYKESLVSIKGETDSFDCVQDFFHK